MRMTRAHIFTTAVLVVLFAGASLGALALGRSSARAARPTVTYFVETPAEWLIAEADGANGRSVPGYTGEIVHRFGAGDVVSATGRIADVQDETWREIAIEDGDTVWVRTRLLSPAGEPPPPITTPTTIPPITPPTIPPTTPTTIPPTTPPTIPAPDFSTERPGLWDVTGVTGYLNVRSGPGVDQPIVARLAHDMTAVESTGKIATLSGVLWRQVDDGDGARGWVQASYLRRHVAPPPAPAFGSEAAGRWDVTGLDSGSQLNVRSGPGTANAVVARLAHDATDIPSTGRIATLSGALWREVEYRSGATGWVSARYLVAHTQPAPVFDREAPGLWDVVGVATGEFLNMRSEPGTSAAVIGRLAHRAAGISGTGHIARLDDALWRQVSWGGSTGWVSARYLAAHVPAPDEFREMVEDFLAARVLGEGAEAFLGATTAGTYETDERLRLYDAYQEAEILQTRYPRPDQWEFDVRLVNGRGVEVFETLTVWQNVDNGNIRVRGAWITE